MRLILRGLAAIGMLALLAAAGLGCDLALNHGRFVEVLLGTHEKVVAACTPVLARRLQDAGFEPRDLEFGSPPEGLASDFGRHLEGPFTFQDGAAGARVDGIMACRLDGTTVTVDFRTRSSPVRAG